MIKNRSFQEEVQQENKIYPLQHQLQTVSPKEYTEVLTLHTAKQLSEKFQALVDQDQYDQAIKLSENVASLLGDDTTFSLPLSMVLYSLNEMEIPVSEHFSLTRLNLLGNHHAHHNFFKTLKNEMLTSDRVDFMVSFTRWSGVQLLIPPLQELAKRNVPVRIITSTYMGITEPKALKQLMQFQNVELRIVNDYQQSFHTKAYLFERQSGQHSVIIGSSNLSQAALTTGYELNVRIPETSYLPVFQQTKEVFNNVWREKTQPVDNQFLQAYEEFQAASQKMSASLVSQNSLYQTKMKPNPMQEQALENLKKTREQGKAKAVIIAATGTGKTYLAAFDFAEYQPGKYLFIAHREELLTKAIETFENVTNDCENFGLLTGSKKEWDKPFLFSTVQTLHKKETLEYFAPDEFDYIVIDEFHHAEASTYQSVLDYFKPTFLLGLTATPERLDGKDVLQICDHNVVYEIRLRNALEAELLAPFHYFGIPDHTIDYDKVKVKNGTYDERSLVNHLKNHERVDYVIKMIDMYGFHGEKMCGLGFCTNIEHAKYMSAEFNQLGYHTTCLTGQDSSTRRQEVIRELEDPHHSLELIFTVDIFNEGIDIPKLNLLLFLRPTESPTIFIQQLGRGLRKTDDKEFVTVLDFIGNYQKSFIIPLALSGQTSQKSFDKDSLRVAVTHEFADLPGGSYVDLSTVTKKEILNKIDTIKLNTDAMLKTLYKQFKHELGRSPELVDFLYSEQAPGLIFFIKKYKSWVQTKRKMEDLNTTDEEILRDSLVLEMVARLEQQLPIKWPYELLILLCGFNSNKITVDEVKKALENQFHTQIQSNTHNSLIKRSMERLATPYQKQKWRFGSIEDNMFKLQPEIGERIHHPLFGPYIQERIHYGLTEFRRMNNIEALVSNELQLTLYQTYTRNELIYLFQSTDQEGTWREGVKRVRNHYLIFINLNKSESVEDHLLYKDYFIDPRHFHWQSQNQTSHESNVGQNFIYHKQREYHIHLFVRKCNEMHGITLPFTYLGEADYVSSHGDKPMNIKWKLHQPVPENLYIDLVN
ncbi:DUF3427 domain-containing protein [Bacillus atrophaeus]|uniref:DUF3427 domain-containing protein n=1 Tax=Bacillus atrophaeus TaxID=1452 RepID=UPI0022811844|nr:DUF3427 domain-containing protein [Bacillus atrophaeus]MCY8507336.1 DUF3427 domain-containing protein [Bacillus atrophaeus]MCY8949117.1 DUF3427 domain-containing protein [Bacillus atrophaeus]MCY8967534.1 DUF3427 domain-containing protein [Bacillus atrophaeus]MED1017218.1 DUF3427 domain-containing protein [Bacillus atrophaeus]MED1032301.1 DUF3427 domain-containing protein [Bacillus atrophaeus]